MSPVIASSVCDFILELSYVYEFSFLCVATAKICI